MNVPNAISSFRVAAGPIFFLTAFIPQWSGGRFERASVVVLWVLFVLIEASDMLDGWVARAHDSVTDTGKLLDPFADVVARMSYFLVFQASGVLPVWMFGALLFREFGILFVRMRMVQHGITLAADIGGKLKTLVYSALGVAGLLMTTHVRLQNLFGLMPWLPWAPILLGLVAVAAAWVSFARYLGALRRAERP